MKLYASVIASGRIGFIAHTGHKRDENGKITEYGKVLREVPLSPNKITLVGFAAMLCNTNTSVKFVAGASNAAPSESDTTLGSYLGKTETLVSTVTTRNSTPDVDGNVWWRVTHRMTFNPGSLGTGPVNVSEGGVVFNATLASINPSTPIGAHGLLVDGGGSPTSISLDASSEYLDMIWEYTEYVKASWTSTVTHTIFGSSVSESVEVRPAYFENTGGAYNYKGWRNMGDATNPGFAPTGSMPYDNTDAPTQVRSTNGLGALNSAPANDSGLSDTQRACNAFTVDDYVSGSKQRTMKVTWLPARANITGGIQSVLINCGHTHWQVSYSPKFDKSDDDQLDLNFTLSMANK